MIVNFAPEITAPLESFAKPAMLPVGEAETVGANINTNTEKRVHKTEDMLDRFIAASVGIFRTCTCLIEPRMLRKSFRLLKQGELRLNQDISGKEPVCKIGSNPHAKVERASDQVIRSANPFVLLERLCITALNLVMNLRKSNF